MTKIDIEIDEAVLTRLVEAYIQEKLGTEIDVGLKDIAIEVKSKQNYRAEWEVAAFRARVNKVVEK